MNTIQVKQCSKCLMYKDLCDFPLCKTSLDGFYSWCKFCNTKSTQQHYVKNRDVIIVKRRIQKQKNAEDWCQFFDDHYGHDPKCEICDCALTWTPKNKTNCCLAVNWDHKHADQYRNVQPSNWLHNHICNDKNKVLWLNFGFGILCVGCNGSLPTDNREQWINRVLDYMERSNGARV